MVIVQQRAINVNVKSDMVANIAMNVNHRITTSIKIARNHHSSFVPHSPTPYQSPVYYATRNNVVTVERATPPRACVIVYHTQLVRTVRRVNLTTSPRRVVFVVWPLRIALVWVCVIIARGCAIVLLVSHLSLIHI